MNARHHTWLCVPKARPWRILALALALISLAPFPAAAENPVGPHGTRFRAMTYDMLDAAFVNFGYTEVLKLAVEARLSVAPIVARHARGLQMSVVF